MDYHNHENNTVDSITAFDTLYTTNEIQLLKVALPLISHDFQPLIAAFIKARELSYCYQMILHTRLHNFSIETAHLEQFFKEAKVYCTDKQKRMFEMFETLQRTMQILEKMQILSDGIPFDGDMDITKLMQLMPLMNSAAQTPDTAADIFGNASKPASKDTSGAENQSGFGTDPASASETDSNDTFSTENIPTDTVQKSHVSEDNAEKDTIPENHPDNKNDKKQIPDSLPPLLANALTGEQKEMYEKFKQKFSSM